MIGKNNPLNIRCGRKYWKGQTGVTKGFCDFESIDFCIRAWLYLCFVSYQRYLLTPMTISQFIHRYCPVGDGANDPDYYVKFVCNRIFVIDGYRFSLQPDRIVNLLSKKEIFALCSQMCLMESSYNLSYFKFSSVYEKLTFVEDRP